MCSLYSSLYNMPTIVSLCQQCIRRVRSSEWGSFPPPPPSAVCSELDKEDEQEWWNWWPVVALIQQLIQIQMFFWMELVLKLAISFLYLTQQLWQHQVHECILWLCAPIIRLFTQSNLPPLMQSHSPFIRRLNRLKQQKLREKKSHGQGQDSSDSDDYLTPPLAKKRVNDITIVLGGVICICSTV